MKKIKLILIFIISLTVSYGQIRFEIVYSTGGHDKAEGIVQTYDEGYAVIGSTEGFIGLSDIYLMKVDKYGTFKWSKTFGGTQVDQGYDIVETKDSGFAIVGYTNSFGNGYQIMFIKTDKNGDTIFTKKIGKIDWDFAYSLKQTSDKGYIIAGETYVTGIAKAYAIKLDSIGNIQWRKTFGGAQNNKFEDVVITSTGSFVFVGSTESYGNGKQIYVVKTNSAGSLSWQKAFGNPGIDFAKSVVELSNGDLVLTGGTNTPPHADIDNYAIKINSFGVLQQSQVVPDYSNYTPIAQNDDWNECVAIWGTDTLIFGGFRTYDIPEPGNTYIYMFTDNLATGQINRFQKFISGKKESVNDLVATKDRGIIAACTAESLSTGSSSIYLQKYIDSLVIPPYSNSILFQYDISSLDENKSEIQVQFYPNPVSNIGYLNIKSDLYEKIKIIIRDISGKIMKVKNIAFSKINSEIELDFSKYAKGIYFVTINQNNKISKTIKISVIN